MNSDQRYKEAVRLIKHNELYKAREILFPIRQEARAAEWIRKIDVHLAKQKSDQHVTATTSRAISVVNIAIGVVVILLVFLSGLLVGRYLFGGNSASSPQASPNFVIVTATSDPVSEAAAPITSLPATDVPLATNRPDLTPTPLTTQSSLGDDIVPAAGKGKWLYSTDVSALDDSSSYFLYLEAENRISAWLSNPTPVLVIRCRNRDYEVYVHADTQFESNLDDEVFVQVRYGDNPVFSTWMNESTTGRAFFFPHGRTAVQSLLTVDRLVLGFTPFNANPVEVIFDTTDLQTAAQPLFEACGRP